MAFNNIVSRSDSSALIPEQVSNEMLGLATKQSAVLQLFRRIPVNATQVRLPILSALPMAYWVQGDTGLKQTTEMAWSNKYLNIEEIAAIMPIPENVASDITLNIWDTAQPFLVEAVGRVLDTAVFFGTNAPSSFPTNILSSCASASNTVTEGTANAAAGSYIGDLDNVISTVEEDGFEVTGFAGSLALRRKLRSARNVQGDRVDPGRIGSDLMTFDGMPIAYPMRGLWATNGSTGTNVRLFAADWSQFVVGVRGDIEYKVLTESVITDNTGAIVYNLPQQDMIALRLKFRIGWQVANTINQDNTNDSTRYPAAALVF